jgi:hypothetical protein
MFSGLSDDRASGVGSESNKDLIVLESAVYFGFNGRAERGPVKRA